MDDIKKAEGLDKLQIRVDLMRVLSNKQTKTFRELARYLPISNIIDKRRYADELAKMAQEGLVAISSVPGQTYYTLK